MQCTNYKVQSIKYKVQSIKCRACSVERWRGDGCDEGKTGGSLRCTVEHGHHDEVQLIRATLHAIYPVDVDHEEGERGHYDEEERHRAQE